MDNYNRSQKGQAIILIALAIVGLLGMTALAIDAGNAFSDRRHAQTAADNAALAGALAKVSDQSVFVAATGYTLDNGYPWHEGTDDVVVINGGPFENCKGEALHPTDDSSEYVEVMIHSSVDAYFGPIVGINQLNNCVYSIARAEPSKWTELLSGEAVAATSCTEKSAIKIMGNSNVNIVGGGVYSNSDDQAYAMEIGNPVALGVPKPPLSAVGKIDAEGSLIELDISEDVPRRIPCDLPDEMFPPTDYCDFTYDEFPPRPHNSDDQVDVDVDPVEIKKSGVYCITGVFNNPNMKTLDGIKVTFVLKDIGLSWSANKDIYLRAPTETSDPFNGVLIYAPKGNTHSLVFNGSSSMDIVGSILAPDADITLNGDFTGSALVTQLIGKTVYMSGTFQGTIQFDDQAKHRYVTPPQVQLTK